MELNKIINADCLDVMRQMPDKSVDLILTDPPYGIGSRFKSKFGMQIKKKKWEDFSWNDKIPPKEVFDEIMRVSKNQIIFGGNYFTQYLKPTNAWLVWDKIGQYDLKNPFSGSGTTAVAAYKLGRQFICTEKDPAYWQKSCARLAEETKQLLLFGGGINANRLRKIIL